jgi:ribosomal protein L40E
MPCSQCGAENPPNTKFCVNCGSPQAAGSPQAVSQPSQYSQPSQAQNPGGFGQAVAPNQPRPPSQVSIDFRRLGTGDIVAAIGLVLLFIDLFLSWYSASDGGISESTSALGTGAGGWRFLILVLDILILIYLFIRTMTPRGLRLPLPHWQLLTALLGLEFLLTLLAFLVKPSAGPAGDGISISWSFGAYIGLVVALIALAGGIMRRNESEIIVPGVPRVGFGSFRAAQQGPGMGATPGGGAQGTVCSQCGSAVPPGTPYCTTCGAPTSG